MASKHSAPGDYLTDGEKLWYLDGVLEDGYLLENCGGGEIVSVSAREFEAMGLAKVEPLRKGVPVGDG